MGPVTPPPKPFEGNPNSGSSSSEFFTTKTSNQSQKKIERSYFTDTSRNGYDGSSTSSVNNGPKYGDDIINDGKQFSIDEESSGNVDPFSDESSYSSRFSIEDDKDLEEESTYLTEENQKRFFPEPGTQDVELGYRVGAKLEDTRDKRKES